MAEKADK
jgi:ankyrin repeat protein